MGFFDKILEGLGFEGNENAPTLKKEKPIKQKKQEPVVNSQFDLQAEKPPQTEAQEILNIVVQKQDDVKTAIDILKNGKSVKLDLSIFDDESINRALDFIWGACYCLGTVLKKVDEKVYILGWENI